MKNKKTYGEIVYIEGIKRYLASEKGMLKVQSYLTRFKRLAVKQIIRKGDDELIIVAKVVFSGKPLDEEELSNVVNDILLRTY